MGEMVKGKSEEKRNWSEYNEECSKSKAFWYAKNLRFL